jgi:hypothetical protein
LIFKGDFNIQDATDRCRMDEVSGRPGPCDAVRWEVTAAYVATLRFAEMQPQILRLTTPELKSVRGPVRSG